MKEYYSFDMQIPSSDSHLINELSKWLRMAGARSKVVVVFDALNQLDDGSGQDGKGLIDPLGPSSEFSVSGHLLLCRLDWVTDKVLHIYEVKFTASYT